MSTYENQTGMLTPQSLLQQRYLIIKQIGRGNMGAVYQAQDTHIANRQVAIKELSQSHLGEEKLAEATAQFQREAATLRALNHPNLPLVYESFIDHERYYLVMDFIEGKTLLQLLKESGGQPFSAAQVLNYGIQLCDVLSYLHQHHPPVIFRDLKPTNVMVTQSGHVFLVDFGIARIFKKSQEKDTVFLGSPGYASPEQYGTSQTNARSDLYSLGATLHFCLTARDPYYATERFSFPPVRQYNPQVPIELDQFIQRLLANNQEQRPVSAQEVKEELTKISQQIIASTNISPSPVAPAPPSLPTPPSNHNNDLPPRISPTMPVSISASPPVSAQINPTLPSFPAIPLNNVSPPLPLSPPLSQTSPDRTLASPSRNISSRPTSIWRPGFFILFGLLLVLTISGTTFALTAICNSYHLVEAGLSAIVVLIAIGAGLVLRGLVPRSLLFSSGLFMLVTNLALITQTLTDKIQVAGDSTSCPPPTLNAHPTVLNLALTFGLVATAIISLFWLVRPFTRINRSILLIVSGIAIACASLQYLFLDKDITKHILLLIALITLLQGVLLVIQMERVGLGGNA